MRLLTVIAVLATSACGADDLVVDVQSRRIVPTEVDSLRITVSDVDETDILRSIVVRLTSAFPAAVLFEIGEETPERLRVEVEARQGQNVVDSAAAEAGREDGTTRIRINLDG
ncbi:MAG: hypothetical protein ACAI38_18620 [Myxococcota bacterium]